MINFNLDDVITLKKKHPCGSFKWKVVKLGADLKIECLNCKRQILISRIDLNKKIKEEKNDK